MADVMDFIRRFFTQTPWIFLSWPALAMIAGSLVGVLSGRIARRLALVPRTAGGLLGLATAPFVHANFSHLLANFPPFLVLGFLVLRRNEAGFLRAALIIALGQGALLWLFGRKAAHVGMSGVIMGFSGYLLAIGYLARTIADLIVAGAVVVFYGGMLAGVAPARDGTSWEGHLFGLIAGVGIAWFQYRG